MRLLHALQEVQRLLRERRNRQPRPRPPPRAVPRGERVVERELVRALPAHRDEDAAPRAGGAGGGGGGDGEVRAAHDAELDAGVDEEREADGVLLAAEETFGAVDGVEGPHAC